MKKIIFFIILISSFPLNAQSAHPFGLGLMIGSPTGFSLEYYLSRKTSIDGALAWDLGKSSSYHFHGDYLFHKSNVFQVDQRPIDFFYGLGARIKTKNNKSDDENTTLGVRIPAGLSHQFRDPRIKIFAEAALVMDFISETDLDIDFSIGGRYYF